MLTTLYVALSSTATHGASSTNLQENLFYFCAALTPTRDVTAEPLCQWHEGSCLVIAIMSKFAAATVLRSCR
ncbi:unnamed protein product [Calypogeia fissa]